MLWWQSALLDRDLIRFGAIVRHLWALGLLILKKENVNQGALAEKRNNLLPDSKVTSFLIVLANPVSQYF